MTRLHALGLGLLLAMTAPAYSQDKPATKPTTASATPAAPAATPTATAPAAAVKPAAAAAAPMAAEKADAPKKKRVAMKRKPINTCTKINDPWDNVCDIQKMAQLACNDLPTGKKVAKKPKKGEAPMTTENWRQQCVDNYMRNV